VLNRVTFSIGPWGRLLWLPCLLACAPSPEVAQAGAGHASWDRTATRTPTPPDADVTTIEPPDQPEVDADVEPEPDAELVLPPDAGRTPRPDAVIAAPDLAPPVNEGPARSCMLTFQVTTVTFNGSYAPRNVGAIWVSDGNGKFVKSLTVWAAKRIRHLVTWEAAANGNTVDAVTSATAGSHGTRTGKWDCTGLDHQPVADGAYRINVEFTERNSLGKVMTPLGFTKGGPVSLMPPDQTNFRAIRLQVSQ
jgi:hypothetical protein